MGSVPAAGQGQNISCGLLADSRDRPLLKSLGDTEGKKYAILRDPLGQW
jgi:hypothetical protein